MGKFVIVSDSCCDLTKELRQEYNVDYIPMRINFDDKEYDADLDWKELSMETFYQLLAEGKRIRTTQILLQDYVEKFTKYLEEGYDILSISCSSALSASVLASYKARDELLDKYPNSKIICIDSLCACMGLGLMCMQASKLRSDGKSIDEVASWIEEHKLEVNQECTVEKLSYLKQAGRVSAASAFFGGILSVKPIIISDAKGQNFAVEKVKGRKNSLNRLVERTKERIKDVDYQNVYVVHAGDEETALIVKKQVEEALENKVDVKLGYIGPIVGATVGPGTVAIYFFGEKVTVNA